MESSRIIRISSLARVFGEAHFIALHNGKIVIDGFFIPYAPIRAFERLIRGKNPLFVIEATMRICGVCHTAHGIASCEAIEQAIGIIPPRNGILLREALGLVNRVQSHILHAIIILKDLIKEQYYDNLISKLFSCLELINNVMSILGGTTTHPPALSIGGIHRTFTEGMIKRALNLLNKLLHSYKSLLSDYLLNEAKWTEKANLCNEVELEHELLASHLFYGDKYNLNVDKVKVLTYQDYATKFHSKLIEDVKDATCQIALYDSNIIEVGPRARLSIYKNFKNNNLMGIQIARWLEVELCLKRIIEILNNIKLDEPFWSKSIVFREGTGIGVYEAPRGTLIHKVKLSDEGRVIDYQIIVPTMFNIPIMEKVIRNTPLEIASLIPRLYDPCIPCVTHLVKVKE